MYPGVQRRFPYAWSAGQGGVLPPTRPAPTSLGAADMLESGYGDPNYLPYPPFNRTILHRAGLGDWPPIRPAGPELLFDSDSEEEGLGWSDSEKTLALVAAAGVAAWWLFFRKRRNPGKRRSGYAITSTTRGVTGTIIMRRKRDALAYARELRESGKPARVKKR